MSNKSIEDAKVDPTTVYSRPLDVFNDTHLSCDDKIDILKRWEYDERAMSVAEEENMRSSNNNRGSVLDEILTCLRDLDATDEGRHSSTKHG